VRTYVEERIFMPCNLHFYLSAVALFLTMSSYSPSQSMENYQFFIPGAQQSAIDDRSNDIGEGKSKEDSGSQEGESQKKLFDSSLTSGESVKSSSDESSPLFPSLERYKILYQNREPSQSSLQDSRSLPLKHLSSSADSSRWDDSFNSDSAVSEEDSEAEKKAYNYSENFSSYFYQLVNQSSLTPEERNDIWQKLHNLGRNFVEDATKYGRIIIEERNLPSWKKALNPRP
jgi:hypothetical protein